MEREAVNFGRYARTLGKSVLPPHLGEGSVGVFLS